MIQAAVLLPDGHLSNLGWMPEVLQARRIGFATAVILG